MSKIAVFDPGHGGHDPGAVANGLREKDLTLDISKRTKRYLERNYRGIKVYLTRTSDKYLTLAQRANYANRKNADLFVSMHINAGGGTGYESFIHTSKASRTVRAQNNVHDRAVKEMAVTNRGKKSANFAVLRLSKMPAILPENLFIDRKADAKKLKSSKFLNKIAKGHAEGIAKCLGLKKKGASTSKSKGSSKTPKKTKKRKKASKSTYTGGSLVDYLKHNRQPSSYNDRKKLARRYGIKNYRGTESQNTRLLNALRGNKSTSRKTTKSKYPLPKGTLRRGSRGNGVRQLQRALNAANFKCGAVDGIYGAKVEDAVRRFQMVHDAYNVDGVYRPRTRTRLNRVVN